MAKVYEHIHSDHRRRCHRTTAACGGRKSRAGVQIAPESATLRTGTNRIEQRGQCNLIGARELIYIADNILRVARHASVAAVGRHWQTTHGENASIELILFPKQNEIWRTVAYCC